MSDRFFAQYPSNPAQPQAAPQQGNPQTPPQPQQGVPSAPVQQGIAPAQQQSAPAVPGVQGLPTQVQPGVQQQQPAQQQQAPQIDPAAFQAAQQENTAFREAFSQLAQRAEQAQRQAEQQSAEAAYKRRIEDAKTAAARMGAAEGQEYLAREAERAVNDLFAEQQRNAQQSQQRMQQAGMRMAMQNYAADIARQNNLTPEQHRLLASQPDMDSIYTMANALVGQNQQISALQQQLTQFQLGQQAQQLGFQQAGMGAGMGAQQPVPVVDRGNMSNDEYAMSVYNRIKSGQQFRQ